jgi:sugar lactone lactonase YvrE
MEIVAEGLLFPEGRVACDDGSLLLVEIARGTLTRIADGRSEAVAQIGGGPNGAAIGPDGGLGTAAMWRGGLAEAPAPARHRSGRQRKPSGG